MLSESEIVNEMMQMSRLMDVLRAWTWEQKPKEVSQEYLSPKVLTLITLLKELFAHPGATGIVFVEQRYTAKIITILLERLGPEILPGINVAMVTGGGTNHGKRCTSIASNNWGQWRDSISKEQQMVVNGFRQGAIRLIIATSALEEGVDVRACNFVIR